MPTTMGFEPEILDIGPRPSGSRRAMVLVVIAVIVAAVGGYFVGSNSKHRTGSPSSAPAITSAASPSSSTGDNAFEHPKLVAGTVSCSESSRVDYRASIGTHLRNGSGGHCVMTSNDPRVAGTDSFTYNADRWMETYSSVGFPRQMGTQWGTSRLANAGGIWVGRFTGVSSNPHHGAPSPGGTQAVAATPGSGTSCGSPRSAPGGPNSGPTNGSTHGLIFAGKPPTP